MAIHLAILQHITQISEVKSFWGKDKNIYYTTGPLNAWIWLADERSEVRNYFQVNAQRT